MVEGVENHIVDHENHQDWPTNEDGYRIRDPLKRGLTLKERFHEVVDIDPAVMADKVDAAAEIAHINKRVRELANSAVATAKVLPEALIGAGKHTFKVIHPTIDSTPNENWEDKWDRLIFDPRSDYAALDIAPGASIGVDAAIEGAGLGIKMARGAKRGADLGSGLDRGVKMADETFDDIAKGVDRAMELEMFNERAIATKAADAAKEATRKLMNPTRAEKLGQVTLRGIEKFKRSGEFGRQIVQTGWNATHPIRAGQAMVSKRLIKNGENMMVDGLAKILDNPALQKQMLDALTPAQRLQAEGYGEAFNMLRVTKPKALGRLLGKEWYTGYMNLERALGRVAQRPQEILDKAGRLQQKGQEFLGSVAGSRRVREAFAPEQE